MKAADLQQHPILESIVPFCYNVSKENLSQLAAIGTNVPIVKLMGLPEKRKLYRNPYVTAADMTKDRMRIDGTTR